MLLVQYTSLVYDAGVCIYLLHCDSDRVTDMYECSADQQNLPAVCTKSSARCLGERLWVSLMA